MKAQNTFSNKAHHTKNYEVSATNILKIFPKSQVVGVLLKFNVGTSLWRLAMHTQ